MLIHRGKFQGYSSRTTHQQSDVCCLNEKLAIALHEEDNILNKGTEIIANVDIVSNKTWRIMTPKTDTKPAIKST